MTNSEKYKTAEEREEERERAHKAWCTNDNKEKKFRCPNVGCIGCAFRWLDLEAEEAEEAEEEKPLPCIYCGNDMMQFHDEYGYGLLCATTQCGATTYRFNNPEQAVKEYNKIARAVMEYGKKEEK